jgi:hypothetical protein
MLVPWCGSTVLRYPVETLFTALIFEQYLEDEVMQGSP